MKKIIFFLLLNALLSCNSVTNNQTSIELINLTHTQLDLMETYKDAHGNKRDSIFLDKIYEPNLELWNSYLGNENDFLKWLNNVSFPELELYQEKSKELNLNELDDFFIETSKKMKTLTGLAPKGKWFIVFGPKWTDAGGFGNSTMVLDLANSTNSLEHVKLIFPHELNHQIYAYTMPSFESIVLKRILNEGFACYVSYLFHDKKVSIAKELQYTEEELKTCIENDDILLNVLKKHYTSNDKDIANNFADRSYQIAKEYPEGIGYYIGFRIVEEYVKKHGEDSWKNIYTLTPEQVLKESGILD